MAEINQFGLVGLSGDVQLGSRRNVYLTIIQQCVKQETAETVDLSK